MAKKNETDVTAMELVQDSAGSIDDLASASADFADADYADQVVTLGAPGAWVRGILEGPAPDLEHVDGKSGELVVRSAIYLKHVSGKVRIQVPTPANLAGQLRNVKPGSMVLIQRIEDGKTRLGNVIGRYVVQFK